MTKVPSQQSQAILMWCFFLGLLVVFEHRFSYKEVEVYVGSKPIQSVRRPKYVSQNTLLLDFSVHHSEPDGHLRR
jgi:hypothetical protein